MYSIFKLPDDFLDRKYTPEEEANFDEAIYKAATTSEESLTEELTPNQKAKVNLWRQWSRSDHDKVFGDKDRIVLDVPPSEPITSDNHKTVHAGPDSPMSTIISMLHHKGYHVEDYAAGLAYHKDNTKRKLKIRGLLGNIGIADSPSYFRSKHGAQLTLGQAFDADPIRAASKGEKKIVITRNPYDVAGMSTNRGWSSCMNMVDGCNRRFLKHDIERGTLTAYLTSKDDANINRPIARINIKQFEHVGGGESGGKYRAWIPEATSYGTHQRDFRDIVNKWAADNYPLGHGVYAKHVNLYDDDGIGYKVNPDPTIVSGASHAKALSALADHLTSRATEYVDDKVPGDEPEVYHSVHHGLDKYTSDTGVADTKHFAPMLHRLISESDWRHDYSRSSRVDDHDSTGHSASWAFNQIEEHPSYEKSLNMMDPHEAIAEASTLHKDLDYFDTAKDSHVFARAHRAFIDHFMRDTRETHQPVREHIIGLMYQKPSAYVDVVQPTNNGRKLSVEHVHNPRLLHMMVDHDQPSPFDSHDEHYRYYASEPSPAQHIGKHADAKLANYLINEHAKGNIDLHKDFFHGLNKNPHGEEIQHQIINHLYLEGGIAQETRPVVSKVNGQSMVNHMPVGAEHVDHNAQFRLITRHTEFPSVIDSIKKRIASGELPSHYSAFIERNSKSSKDPIAEAYRRVK
jgi:hypothetical protein